MCNRYAGDVTNDIWGMKMKDWVTPDYPTVRPLTAEHYLTTDKSEELDFPSQSDSRIDEGPFMHYEDFTDDGVDNGTYFLTFSLCGGGSHLYAPLQATATEPLGNFVKVKVADGGFVINTDPDWDIEAAGHHDFFYIGDEIWMSYHSYRYVNGEVETRY